jgi:hypothetical protein
VFLHKRFINSVDFGRPPGVARGWWGLGLASFVASCGGFVVCLCAVGSWVVCVRWLRLLEGLWDDLWEGLWEEGLGRSLGWSLGGSLEGGGSGSSRTDGRTGHQGSRTDGRTDGTPGLTDGRTDGRDTIIKGLRDLVLDKLSKIIKGLSGEGVKW